MCESIDFRVIPLPKVVEMLYLAKDFLSDASKDL